MDILSFLTFLIQLITNQFSIAIIVSILTAYFGYVYDRHKKMLDEVYGPLLNNISEIETKISEDFEINFPQHNPNKVDFNEKVSKSNIFIFPPSKWKEISTSNKLVISNNTKTIIESFYETYGNINKIEELNKIFSPSTYRNYGDKWDNILNNLKKSEKLNEFNINRNSNTMDCIDVISKNPSESRYTFYFNRFQVLSFEDLTRSPTERLISRDLKVTYGLKPSNYEANKNMIEELQKIGFFVELDKLINQEFKNQMKDFEKINKEYKKSFEQKLGTAKKVLEGEIHRSPLRVALGEWSYGIHPKEWLNSLKSRFHFKV